MGNPITHHGSGISSETAAIPLQSAPEASATGAKEHSELQSDGTRGLEATALLTHPLCPTLGAHAERACSGETTQGSPSHLSG